MLLDLIDPTRESGGSQTTKLEFSIKPYLISIKKESIIVTRRLTKLSPQTVMMTSYLVKIQLTEWTTQKRVYYRNNKTLKSIFLLTLKRCYQIHFGCVWHPGFYKDVLH